MRKKIGIFVGEIAQDYQRHLAHWITARANGLGYDTVFICSYGSYNHDLMYAEGEKALMHLPDLTLFDGIIVAEDVFDIDGMGDELYEIIKSNAKCPVVYLRTIREGCYSILPDNWESMEKMVRHFTDVHGFTDICYMSGKQGFDDSKQRLDAYLNVMQEHGIEVTEHMVFHGDYWRNKGKEAVDWFMQGRDTYPQAIVCANDYMALSICEELQARGVKIPEQVCVSGFDFLDEARNNNPTLTSLEIDFEAMVNRAVDIIHSVNSGNKEDYIQTQVAKLRLHSSCGCGGQYEGTDDEKFEIITHKLIDDTKDLLISVTEYQDAFDFDEYMNIADRYRNFLHTKKSYFCFCDEEEHGYGEVENDNEFTEQVILRRVLAENKNAEKAFIKFQRSKILPDELLKEEEYNNLFVFGVHYKNRVYGYVVTKMPENSWFDIYTQGYFMILANAIENSETHRKMEKLETIRSIYQKDALTGILNRRGFDKKLQEKYAAANNGGRHIGLVSIDMDNLKIINDNYGHAEGDKALMAIAKALSSVMKEGDVCARVGGDEFAAVIMSEYPGRCNEFKREFANALKTESVAFPDYDLCASVGICESSEKEVYSLVSCIQLADKRMYEDKKSRKMQRV